MLTPLLRGELMTEACPMVSTLQQWLVCLSVKTLDSPFPDLNGPQSHGRLTLCGEVHVLLPGGRPALLSGRTVPARQRRRPARVASIRRHLRTS